MKAGLPYRGLLVFFVSILLSLAIAESIARIVALPDNREGYFAHQEAPIGMKPNYTFVFTGIWTRLEPTTVSINSYGFRDYDYAVSKPAGVKRIVGMGDSQTFGHGVELEQTYLKVLEDTLAEEKAGGDNGTRWEVLNLGAPGYNARQKIDFFNDVGLRFSPDIVIIQLDDADCFEDEDVSSEHSLSVRIQTSLGKIDSALANLLQIYLEKHMFPGSDRPIDSTCREEMGRQIERLVPVAEDHGFEVVVLLMDYFIDHETLNYFNESLPGDLFHTLSLGDGQALLGYPPEEKFCLHPGDCHYSPAGHAVIAQVLREYLETEDLI